MKSSISLFTGPVCKLGLKFGFAVVGSLMLGVAASAGISLEMQAPKSVYLVDEPMYATVNLRNTGTADELILRYLNPNQGILRVDITAPDGESHTLSPQLNLHFTMDVLANRIINLAPNSSYSSDVEIRHDVRNDRKSTAFVKPGQYEIQCVYAPPTGLPLDTTPIYSNKMSITVAEPVGDDRIVYQLLHEDVRTKENGIWNIYPYQASCYERIISEYADSGYAVHARFCLAQRSEYDGHSIHRGTALGASSFQRAAKLFQDVANSAVSSGLRAYALRLAGRCYAKLDDLPQAQRLLEESFALADATDEDRLQTLTWMDMTESGEFQNSSGLSPSSSSRGISIPLRQFASASGFETKWDPSRRLISVTSAKVRGALDLRKGMVTINGIQVMKVKNCIENGRALVPPTVVANLIAERYGKGMRCALSQMLARSMPPEKLRK